MYHHSDVTLLVVNDAGSERTLPETRLQHHLRSLQFTILCGMAGAVRRSLQQPTLALLKTFVDNATHTLLLALA